MELGPRALALLRRAVAALEALADMEQRSDPGKASEDDTTDWPEVGDE